MPAASRWSGQPTGMDCADERLTALHITTPQDTTLPLPLDVLVVPLAYHPAWGPIADQPGDGANNWW